MTNNTDLLENCVLALEECADTLEKIATTCCMPERSSNMKAAEAKLKSTALALKDTYNNSGGAHVVIENIGQFGSQLGFLYATCCTATREPMYQNIFKHLMIVHDKMWAVMGHTH